MQEGRTIFRNSSFLPPPRVRISFRFSGFTSPKPVYRFRMQPKMATDIPATMMVRCLAPSHTMRRGARADFGRLFRTTRYGSSTFARRGQLHSKTEIPSPARTTKAKLRRVSFKVAPMWTKRDWSCAIFTKVWKIMEGLLKIKESIQPSREKISHCARKIRKTRSLAPTTRQRSLFCRARYAFCAWEGSCILIQLLPD